MNKDSSDFMITEYDRISTEYLGLQVQVNDWFKAYLTIVGFPLTVLAAALKLGTADITASINFLPDVVAAVLILVSLLGFFVTISIIAMRMEMILYVRTINIIRRFFGEKDKKLVLFFILPTSDKLPPFYEPWGPVFWQITLMGLLDGIIAGLGVNNLLRTEWWFGLRVGIGFIAVHFLIYLIFAWVREYEWTPKFAECLTDPHIAGPKPLTQIPLWLAKILAFFGIRQHTQLL
jgi:hypothetical protein